MLRQLYDECAPSAYALGGARAELLANLKHYPGWAVASHDPDGHPLIFSRLTFSRTSAHGTRPAGNSQ